LAAVAAAVGGLAADFERGRQVREGTWVAIVGPPNAGKSSLLNALLGSERALVSEFAGTTRDTIDETLAIEGVRLRIVDTAGLRESSDPLELAGMKRAQEALSAAHLALVVVDGSQPLRPAAREVLAQTRGRERVVFFNKRDLGSAGYDGREPPEREALFGSVREAAGVAELARVLAQRVRGSERPDLAQPHLATARQAAAAIEAQRLLSAACAGLRRGDPADLCTGDLIGAIAALGTLTGRDAGEAVLDGVFARFCIGK
jgi:tRNA modification GTPase